METSGLLQPFIIIYKELKFFFHTHVYKSLIRDPKYMRSQSIKRCPYCSRIVPAFKESTKPKQSEKKKKALTLKNAIILLNGRQKVLNVF